MDEHFNITAASLHLCEASKLLQATDSATSDFLLKLAKAVIEDAGASGSELSTAQATLSSIDDVMESAK